MQIYRLPVQSPESLPINPVKWMRAWQKRNNEISISGVHHEDDGVTNAATASFELCSVCFVPPCPARHFSWLQESTPCCIQSPVFMCTENVFWLVFACINSATSDVTSARLSGGYRPVRSICFAGILDNVHFYHITLTEIEFPLMHFCVS